MRRPLLGLVVALGISAGASQAQAQVPFSNVNDPFFAYYSYYLPRQQALANSSGPEQTINAFAAERQRYAATNRNGMFDPSGQQSGLGDPLFEADTLNSGARKRTLSAVTGRYGVHGGNLNGLGPAGFYNSKLNNYYPNLRAGRGRNANTAQTRSRGYSGGFGNLGGGLPGPR